MISFYYKKKLSIRKTRNTHSRKERPNKSNSTIEKLENGVKLFKINGKDTKRTSMTSFWCLYC